MLCASPLRSRLGFWLAALGLATLAWPSHLQAAEQRRPPDSRTPRLLAQIEDRQVAIELESLEASVVIHGFLAETTLEMTFFNSDPRLLEGEFMLWLPDGAVVCGFGLDVDGEMVDAVVVEKQKARIVFDRETRRQIDPGLIEWSGGNRFRTRIYPIEGESRRRIRVKYLETLQFQRRFLRRSATYRLPLRGLGPVDNVGLTIEVMVPDRRPRVVEHPFVDLGEAVGDGKVTFRARATDLTPERDLGVVVSASGRTLVMAEEVTHEAVTNEAVTDGEADRQVAFAVADFRQPRRRSAVASRPRRVAVFWDASLSQAAGDDVADRTRALDVLDQLLRRWRPTETQLVVFRHRAQASLRFEGRQGSADLVETLAATPFDGASGWQDLELPSDFDADAVLLFSDGRINFGSRRPPDFGVPTYVFDRSADSNSSLLQYLAHRGGGAYFDLTSAEPSKLLRRILRRIRRPESTLAQVTLDHGTVERLEAPLGQPTDGPIFVAGHLVSTSSQRPAKLSLRYGPSSSRRVKVEAQPGPGSGLASKFWAKQRLQRLALFPEENRQELLELGRRYGLVTPSTSLLVLENVEQYVEYEVEPPAMLAEMRREYHVLRDEMKTEVRDLATDHVEWLEEQWLEFLDVAGKTYDVPPPGSLSPENASRRTTRAETARAETAGARAAGPYEEPPADPSRVLQWAPAHQDPVGVDLPAPQTVGGVVFLDDGSTIPGASVVIESASLLEPLTLFTNVNGVYRTPVLTPGQYEFRFQLEGFSTVQQSVQVSRGDALGLDVELGPAAVRRDAPRHCRGGSSQELRRDVGFDGR